MSILEQRLDGLTKALEALNEKLDRSHADNKQWLASQVKIDAETHTVLLKAVQQLSKHFEVWFELQNNPLVTVRQKTSERAGPEPFICPKCRAQHDRGWFGGVPGQYRCLHCGYTGPSKGVYPNQILEDFHECATCAAKPGTPTLCSACLHNRALVSQLKEKVATAEKELDEAIAERNKTREALKKTPLKPEWADLLRILASELLNIPLAIAGGKNQGDTDLLLEIAEYLDDGSLKGAPTQEPSDKFFDKEKFGESLIVTELHVVQLMRMLAKCEAVDELHSDEKYLLKNGVLQALHDWLEELPTLRQTRAESILDEFSEAMTKAVDEKDARSMGEELQKLLWGAEELPEYGQALARAQDILQRYGYGPEEEKESPDDTCANCNTLRHAHDGPVGRCPLPYGGFPRGDGTDGVKVKFFKKKPKERELTEVIDEMIKHIPQAWEDLSKTLKGIRDSARFSPPEGMGMWWEQATEALEDEIGRPTESWQMRVGAIFSGRPIVTTVQKPTKE